MNFLFNKDKILLFDFVIFIEGIKIEEEKFK